MPNPQVYKTGYVNGSDITFIVGIEYNEDTQTYSGGRALGHCSQAQITINNTYLEVCSKPTSNSTRGVYTQKVLTDQSISITATGFHFYDESDYSYKWLCAKAISGEPFIVKMVERRESESVALSAYSPLFMGEVVINTLPLSLNAGTAVSYQIDLINNGEPITLDASNLHVR